MKHLRALAFLSGLVSLGVVINLLGCICATSEVTVTGGQQLESGTTTELVLALTPLMSDIPSDLSIVLDVGNAPPGSELHVEVAPGMELVGIGPNLRLEMRDFDRLLAACDGECEYPVTVTLAESDSPATYFLSLLPGDSTTDCVDTKLEARLR